MVVALALAGSRARCETAPPLFQPAVAGPTRELRLGEVLPDVTLLDEQGRKTSLGDLRGNALALTFFYSRCPAPTYCPLVSRNFDVTQGLLAKLGAAGRCHLLSISLDPAHDTPEVLAAYARSCQADPLLWTFATGAEKDVRGLGAAVGLEWRSTAGRVDHNLRTVVLDAQGRVRHIFRGDTWTPQELAAELLAAARSH